MSIETIGPSTWSAWPHLYGKTSDLAVKMDGWAIHWPGSKASSYANPTLAQSIARLRSWEKYHHLDRGYSGGLAYDWAIDLAGRIFEVRAEGRSAATSGDYDSDGIPNNKETDGILLILGTNDRPSEAMLRALVELIDELGGPRRYIIGHRQARPEDPGWTTCPGDSAMATIVQPIQRHGFEAWALDHRDIEEDIMASIEELRAVVREEARSAVEDRWADRKFKNWVDGLIEPVRVTIHSIRRDSAAARVAAVQARDLARAAGQQAGLSEVDLAHIEALVENALANGIQITGQITAVEPE